MQLFVRHLVYLIREKAEMAYFVLSLYRRRRTKVRGVDGHGAGTWDAICRRQNVTL